MFSGLWELPVDKGNAAALVLGRWRMNGIAAFQRGFPSRRPAPRNGTATFGVINFRWSQPRKPQLALELIF